MYGGLSAKERLAQLQQKSAKDSGGAKPGTAPKTNAANGKTPAPKTETAKPGAKDTAQAKEETKKQEPVKPKEEPKKVEPVKPKEEPKKPEPVKPKEEPKKPEPVKPKEEPKKPEPVKPKEEPKKPEPVKPKEEPKKPEPVKPKEEPKKPEPVKPKEEPKTPEPPKPKEEPKVPEPVKPKEEPKQPEPVKIAEEPKKVEPVKPKEEPKKIEVVKPTEGPKQMEPPKSVVEVKKPELTKSETEPKKPEAANPVAEPQKPEASKSVEAPKKLEPETPKVEAKKPVEQPNAQITKQTEITEHNKPREVQNPPAQQTPPTATPSAPPTATPPAPSTATPSAPPTATPSAPPTAAPTRPEEPVKPKEDTKKKGEEETSANISRPMEAQPVSRAVEPGKAAPASGVTREEARKVEAPVQPAKTAEVPRKPEEKPAPHQVTQGAIRVESVAPVLSNAAPIKVEQVPAGGGGGGGGGGGASAPRATGTEPAKPKEVEFRAAEDDFYANIFYFSGMGSLIGSALASGVYVPEKTQRNAIEAEEVDQARARHDAARRGNEVIVIARQQAQGLSADFRQLQSLLESLPTFTEAPGTKPYDRRAVDEPIHGHVYFSHDQRQHQQQQHQHQQQHQQQQQQQQQRSGQTQPQSVVGAQTVKPAGYPSAEDGGIASYLNQEAFQNSGITAAATQRDASNQYPFGSRDNSAAVTASPQSQQRHFQPPPIQSTASRDPERHGAASRTNGTTGSGGGGGGGILASIDQFDRALAAETAAATASRAFGSASASVPPSQSNRYETTTMTTIRHYENAPDYGNTRDSYSAVQHGSSRPTSSPRPYADQSSGGGGGGGGGSVDPTGIKPWQLSHLRPLEAKGYNIVAESEKSFAHGASSSANYGNRGSGVRSPYQQQEVIEYTPVVAVTAKPTGSINHPYAASLEMPYCDL